MWENLVDSVEMTITIIYAQYVRIFSEVLLTTKERQYHTSSVYLLGAPRHFHTQLCNALKYLQIINYVARSFVTPAFANLISSGYLHNSPNIT
jgi:hypothetical protein